MPPHRDVAAFDERAPGYEQGSRGRLHHDIADRAAELALSVHAAPRRVLDVGCGTGYLLRLLAGRCPHATELAGIDPAPSMIEAAEQAADDRRLRFTVGAAERLPYPDGVFDLVASTTSFDHWADQRAGLGECDGDSVSQWPLPFLRCVGRAHPTGSLNPRDCCCSNS